MNIGIVGLNLIGGSMAEAIKAHTEHTVYGFNRSPNAFYAAKLYKAVDDVLDDETLPLCDVVIVCTYLEATATYIKEHAPLFRKGALVIDCSGVKRSICEDLEPLVESYPFTFMGGHPMAGKTNSGFKAASPTLFKGASMILTPYKTTPIGEREVARDLFLSIGFKKVHFATPEVHDEKIAYTSQLPHLISNAFAKSPTAEGCVDISAGSYRDMIRVAKFDAAMWTELFMENRDFLIAELDGLTGWLSQYSQALKQEDAGALAALLEDGGEG